MEGDCFPESGGNELRVSRINPNNGIQIYSLIINVVTEKKIMKVKSQNGLLVGRRIFAFN